MLGLTLLAGIVGTISIALLNEQNALLARRWVSEGRPAALEALYKSERICNESASGKLVCGDHPVANFRARLEALDTYVRIQKEEGRAVNLSGVDLRGGLIVSAPFAGAMLTEANFSKSSIQESSFAQAKLSFANFRGVTLRSIDFEGAQLNGARFDGATLTDVSFEGASIKDASFRKVTMTVAGEKMELPCSVVTVAVDWQQAKGLQRCIKAFEKEQAATKEVQEGAEADAE